MDNIYKAKYLGKPINLIDCNNCAWLNITEEEQEKIKGLHICQFYNHRVIHRTNCLKHSSILYPCDECYKDDNKYFIEREKRGN